MVYLLFAYRIKRREISLDTDTFLFYPAWAMIGVIVGGRIGYALFYNFSYYSSHPLEIILPFDFSNGFRFVGLSGMSYHGGLIGLVLVTIYFCHRYKINFWQFGDWLCTAAPLGYMFGRLGNFINGELWGRVTTAAWGMYFPLDKTQSLRHPSQLYEALFEGLFLFCVLWLTRKRNPFDGFMIGLYIFGYGLVRFIIEYFREPDAQLGFVLGFNTMGQILCTLMMLTGIVIIFWRRQASTRRK